MVWVGVGNPTNKTNKQPKMSDAAAVTIIVVLAGVLGLLFAALYAYHTSLISLKGGNGRDSPSDKLLVQEDGLGAKSVLEKVSEISDAISQGANAFLFREYRFMAWFILGFDVIIVLFIGLGTHNWKSAVITALSFTTGSVTSIVSGYIGMKIAVYANSRTAVQAQHGMAPAFTTAFKAAAVMGFALISVGILVLLILLNVVRQFYPNIMEADKNSLTSEDTKRMFEAIAGYGLGGSSIALFGRVGGGIYTKAADVGADLCGKLEFDIPEDDPRNPAVIADNVGDNVGDVAGMGSDLFGSFAEATCAAMVIAADSPVANGLSGTWAHLTFPLTITASGILVCIVTSLLATHLQPATDQASIEPVLKKQLIVSTVLMTPTIYALCAGILPHTFSVSGHHDVKAWHIFICISFGLWSGLLIGIMTEYYTSHSYTPVREVSSAARTGAATVIIYGLALGYKSVIVPAFAMAATIFVSFELAGMFGIAMAALGILSTMAIGLTVDAYGPICDNAGGIAEMAGMGEDIRDRTDALDAAGNTTAAIGKGFAIGSAALVSLALFGGFVTIIKSRTNNQVLETVDILQPFQFAGLLVGAMIPYWFSAMTMKSVGMAALAMVEEVRHQFSTNPNILHGTEPPNYARCVGISTDASLREMIPPGALVMITPLITGYLFGVEALAGVLAGALVSGVQMAISASNTGGAWDNAKKYIEAGQLGDDIGKGSNEHHAAVIGDTVGDPLKDTSGPALNIVMKLMAIISLVFAAAMPTHAGGYIGQLFHLKRSTE
eukprot:TRINITY_DN66469_c9_g3_i1.p2 TRINITY_DN66469_c9_g3~~TRINITY_DN66469_c9_g3_i1.p2  ORF type:complete len:779 (+),score=421.01 TRINITY_DN66469_c9_g3_i1:642-2978(+)